MRPDTAGFDAAVAPRCYLAASLVGAGVFLIAWYVMAVVTADRDGGGRRSAYEVDRRRALRKANRVYLWFEPLVDSLAEYYSGRRDALKLKIAQDLNTLADQPPWRPEEWLAVSRLSAWVQVLGLGALTGWFCWSAFGTPVFAVVPTAVGYYALTRSPVNRLSDAAVLVRSRVRLQLPFATDLLRLMLKAGTILDRALPTLVRETRRSPLSVHLAIMTRDLELGVSRSQALTHLQDRLAVDEVREFVTVLRQGDELGTRMTPALESHAAQLRNRQAQAIERAAEQAKVKFTGPSTLIMIACMIAMIGPWVLKVLYDYRSLFG